MKKTIPFELFEQGQTIYDRQESLQYFQNRADSFIQHDKLKIIKQLQLFS